MQSALNGFCSFDPFFSSLRGTDAILSIISHTKNEPLTYGSHSPPPLSFFAWGEKKHYCMVWLTGSCSWRRGQELNCVHRRVSVFNKDTQRKSRFPRK